jgi:hypothetical protein
MREEIAERECKRKKTDGVGTRREQTVQGRRDKKVQNVQLGEKDNRAHVEWMQPNGRQGEKGTGRNTEWRRTGDRMDARYMEKEELNGKRNG